MDKVRCQGPLGTRDKVSDWCKFRSVLGAPFVVSRARVIGEVVSRLVYIQKLGVRFSHCL